MLLRQSLGFFVLVPQIVISSMQERLLSFKIWLGHFQVEKSFKFCSSSLFSEPGILQAQGDIMTWKVLLHWAIPVLWEDKNLIEGDSELHARTEKRNKNLYWG